MAGKRRESWTRPLYNASTPPLPAAKTPHHTWQTPNIHHMHTRAFPCPISLVQHQPHHPSRPHTHCKKNPERVFSLSGFGGGYSSSPRSCDSSEPAQQRTLPLA